MGCIGSVADELLESDEADTKEIMQYINLDNMLTSVVPQLLSVSGEHSFDSSASEIPMACPLQNSHSFKAELLFSPVLSCSFCPRRVLAHNIWMLLYRHWKVMLWMLLSRFPLSSAFASQYGLPR